MSTKVEKKIQIPVGFVELGMEVEESMLLVSNLPWYPTHSEDNVEDSQSLVVVQNSDQIEQKESRVKWMEQGSSTIFFYISKIVVFKDADL